MAGEIHLIVWIPTPTGQGRYIELSIQQDLFSQNNFYAKQQ